MPDSTKYDLDYRPANYWGSREAMFANVKGEVRRQAIWRAMADGRLEEVPEEVRADILSPLLREAAGRIHPTFMGGEYLPDYWTREVEIARVVCDSTTRDVESIRARRSGGRIRYRIVNEYETKYKTVRQSSTWPLTMRQLIHLIDTATCDEWEGAGGLTTAARDLSYDNADPERLADFVRVSSPFYPQLESWYAEEAAEWVEKKQGELDEPRILTDRKHGPRKLRKWVRRLTGDWELILKGETSQTLYNQWVCAFYLGRSADASVYALRMDEFGDPDNSDHGDKDWFPYSSTVAVFDRPGTADESYIARLLLSVYQKRGGKYVQGINEVGRFALW
jgi:hypothetical protein